MQIKLYGFMDVMKRYCCFGILMWISLWSLALSAQSNEQPVGTGTMIYLDAGLQSVPPPREASLGCVDDEGQSRTGCSMVYFEIEDELRNTYECLYLFVESQNVHDSIFDIINPLNCKPYRGEPLAPSRYVVDVSSVPPSAGLQALICPNEGHEDMEIRIASYLTPSGACTESDCGVYIECQDSIYVLPDSANCEYTVPDIGEEIVLVDTCDVVRTEYYISQKPNAGTPITRDTVVSYEVFIDVNGVRVLLDTCSIELKLKLDTIPPTFEVFQLEDSVLNCESSLPLPSAFTVESDTFEVVGEIVDYERDICNGFPVDYRFIATDYCDNVDTVYKRITVAPDTIGPLVEALDTVFAIVEECEGRILVPPLSSLDDDCSPIVETSISQRDTLFAIISDDVQIGSTIEYVPGFLIYSVMDSCGNVGRDTSIIVPEYLDTLALPPFDDSISLHPGEDCIYEFPDVSDMVNIMDTCDLDDRNYIVVQEPPAGTVVTQDTTLTVYLMELVESDSIVLDSQSVAVNLVEDSIGPYLGQPLDSTIVMPCGTDTSDINLEDITHDTFEVEITVLPFTENKCEGYAVTYQYTAIDYCDNVTVLSRRYVFEPDTTAPVFEIIDTVNSEVNLCEGMFGVPLPVIVDDCQGEVDWTVGLYEDDYTFIREVFSGDTLMLGRGFLIYEATDSCGNSAQDTVVIVPEILDDVELKDTLDSIDIFANDSCEYIIPDLTDQYELSDSCYLNEKEYIITQEPLPGLELSSDTVLQVWLTEIMGEDSIVIDSDMVVVQVIEDTVGPYLGAPLDSVIVMECGSDTSDIVLPTIDNDTFDVTVTISSFTPDVCEGYEVIYTYISEDYCENITRLTRRYVFPKDSLAPVMLLPDTLVSEIVDCEAAASVPTPTIIDSCGSTVDWTAALYDADFMLVGTVEADDSLPIASGYLVYEAIDSCDNRARDTVVIVPSFLDTVRLLDSLDSIDVLPSMDCEYIIPDLTDRYMISDTCDLNEKEYVVVQNPEAGLLVDSDTLLEVYLLEIMGTDTMAIDSDRVVVDVIEDTTGPFLGMPLDSTIIMECGQDTSDIDELAITHDTFDVSMNIVPFTGDVCAGYEVVYEYSSTDNCENTTILTRRYVFPRDSTPPVVTLPDSIDMSLNVCVPEYTAPVPTVEDVCGSTVDWTINLYDTLFNLIRAVEAGEELSVLKGHLIYEISDSCNNQLLDTIVLDLELSDTIMLIDTLDSIDLEANAECIYELPDITDAYAISDTCSDNGKEYLVIQEPSANEVVDADTVICVYLLEVMGLDSMAIDSDKVVVNIIEDTTGPLLGMPLDSTIIMECGQDTSDIIAPMVTNDSFVVDMTVSDFEVSNCEGYEAVYTYSATDNCQNTTVLIRRYIFPPDTVAPILSLPDSIGSQDKTCEGVFEIPSANALEVCSDSVMVEITLYDSLWMEIGSVQEGERISLSQGFIVYNAADTCGNEAIDTIPVIYSIIDDVNLLGDLDSIDISHDEECIYRVPDVTDDFAFADSCGQETDSLIRRYAIIQDPPAGTVLSSPNGNTGGQPQLALDDNYRLKNNENDIDSILRVYLVQIDNGDSTIIDSVLINMNIVKDNQGPILFSDTRDSIQLMACNMDPTSLKGPNVMSENGYEVFVEQQPYKPDICNGYSINFLYHATDECDNRSELRHEYRIVPDTAPPVFFGLPGNIRMSEDENCETFFIVPDLQVNDECSIVPTQRISLHDQDFNHISSVPQDTTIYMEDKAYLIYEAIDACGNQVMDTVPILPVNPPTIVPECPDEVFIYSSVNRDCYAIANWELPTVQTFGRCNNIQANVEQTSGPKIGDTLEVGTYEVEYEISIPGSNTNTVCGFNVIVEDNEARINNCVAELNYSVDAGCELEFFMDALFEEQRISCAGLYNIRLYDRRGVAVTEGNFKDYVGRSFNYEICLDQDVGEPVCCVGSVNIEDKVAPQLECSDKMTFCLTGNDTIFPTVLNECIPVTWEVETIESEEICHNNDDFIRVITQTFVAIDAAGNRSEPCTQKTYIRKLINTPAFIDSIFERPADTVLDCSQLDDFLNDDIYLPGPTHNGVDLHRLINLISECGVAVYKEPDELVIDNGCYRKYRRVWKVLEDACDNITLELPAQIIEFEDTEAPEFSNAPQDTVDIVSAGGVDCSDNIFINAPTLIDNCDESPRGYIRTEAGDTSAIDGSGLRLAPGVHRLYFVGEDACGNTTEEGFYVNLEDRNTPVAVCLEYTTVSLSNGMATLRAENLDRGSYDPCDEEISFLVRRMDTTCVASDTAFSESVSFCCADIGQEVMVVFQVTDASGNTNTCMVVVEVQDKSTPTLICPPDLNVNCEVQSSLVDSADYSLYFGGVYPGDPVDVASYPFDGRYIIQRQGNGTHGYYQSLCNNLIVRESITDNRTNCGDGVIVRRFELLARDGTILEQCEQRVTFVSDNAVIADSIQWPMETIKIDSCVAFEDIEEQLFGRPTYHGPEGNCTDIYDAYKDLQFTKTDTTLEEDVCYKVRRTWTLKDWCEDKDDPGYTFVQWIVVYDDTDTSEVIEEEPDTMIVDNGDTTKLGKILSGYDDTPIANVVMSLKERPSGEITHDVSDEQGFYGFGNISPDGYYELTADMDDHPAKGVTAFDVLLLKQHILARRIFDNIYEYAAGDINQDSYITNSDVVFLQFLTLGYISEYEHGRSWTFWQETDQWDPYDPFVSIRHMYVFNRTGPSDVTWRAAKIGDINGSYSEVKSRTKNANAKTITLENWERIGNQIKMRINFSQIKDLLALQGRLKLSASHNVRVTDVSYDNEDIAVLEDTDEIRFVYTLGDENVNKPVALNVTIEADENMTNSAIINAIEFETEYYDEWVDNPKRLAIEWQSNGASENSTQVPQMMVYQNTPNPFRNNTKIGVHMSAVGEVDLQVRDMHGELVLRKRKKLAKGDHYLEIYGSELPSPGVYYYTILCGAHRETKKLIFLNY